MQANKEQLKKRYGVLGYWGKLIKSSLLLDGYILELGRFDFLFLKGVFIPSFGQQKKQDYTKREKLNAIEIGKKYA